MELKSFQIEASEQIAERYESYMNDPLYIRKNEIVPFYQNLSAITGAGKTLVLADAIEQIRAMTTTQPVVLWLSKGKVDRLLKIYLMENMLIIFQVTLLSRCLIVRDGIFWMIQKV